MKIKVEDHFASANKRVKIQIGGKWYDFGDMNFKEREELAQQLRDMARELVK